MIPVLVTDRGQRLLSDGRRSRAEIFGAESPGGEWLFTRTEDAGTPWIATHRDVRGWEAWFGSLSKARAGADRQLGFDIALGIGRVWGSHR